MVPTAMGLIESALGSPPDLSQGARARKAAEDFEALLVAQLLRIMREVGDTGGTGGVESDSVLEFAEQQMAKALAAQGGLGLASVVLTGLRAREDARTTDADDGVVPGAGGGPQRSWCARESHPKCESRGGAVAPR